MLQNSKRLWILLMLLIASASCQAEDSGLKVGFSARGLEQISFRGMTLHDLGKFPNDAVHVWHLKMTDLKGAPLTSGQYGWGENNNGKVWDAINHMWTYSFSWGTIQVKFVPSPNSLAIEVTETNKAGSGVVLDGANIYALGMHFPQPPKAFSNPKYPQISDGISGPSVLRADYGNGLVTIVGHDSPRPFYSGYLPEPPVGGYSVLVSSTEPPGLAVFQPRHDRPVRPGETDRFSITLEFAESDHVLSNMEAESYRNWRSIWPPNLNWQDRRIIGTAYLASSPTGDPTKSGGYANNPRRYFNDFHKDDFDVKTPDGLKNFQARVLTQAISIVTNLRRLNAQGVITWDVEGEEYPQETSYVCSPDLIPSIAPEMESVIKNPASKYQGMNLVDGYFKTIRDAGFRVGVCIRPQHFAENADGSAHQRFLSANRVQAELVRKMKYAHDRWGVTLFYLDSTVERDGAVLDASIIEKVAAAFPDSLLIPEESNTRFYAYSAPLRDFLFHGFPSTDSAVRATYSKAFSAVLVNDANPAKVLGARSLLVDAIAHGDILMVHADYWHANNDTILEFYSAAQKTK